jgi:hypothetical protein
LNNCSSRTIAGAVKSAIFSGLATAMAFGTTSEKTIITKDITIDATTVPISSPSISMNKLVAIVVHKVLARLLPISNVLITLSFIFMIFSTVVALLLPSDFNLCNFPGADAVIDVSPAAISAPKASNPIIRDIIRKTIYVYLLKKSFTRNQFN